MMASVPKYVVESLFQCAEVKLMNYSETVSGTEAMFHNFACGRTASRSQQPLKSPCHLHDKTCSCSYLSEKVD
jgi:hypothetical protein